MLYCLALEIDNFITKSVKGFQNYKIAQDIYKD